MSNIDMNLDGLQDDIARLIAGGNIIVDTESFQNDVETFNSKGDVLTLLIHLGYLSNEEVSDSYDEDDESLTGMQEYQMKKCVWSLRIFCAKLSIKT